jgi:hypothetical protein
MVGIGGGALSLKHDIRLGDAAVSSPAGRTGRVFRYGFWQDDPKPEVEADGGAECAARDIASGTERAMNAKSTRSLNRSMG